MRRLALLVIALLAVAAPLACTGDGGGGDEASAPGETNATAETTPREAVAAAATKTAEAGTARLSFAATMEIPGVAEPINMTGQGATDNAAGRSRMTLDMSELAAAAGGELGRPAAWKSEVVYDRGVIYIRLPYFNQLLPAAKRWVKVNAKTLAEQGGTQFSSPSPEELLYLAQAASDRAERVGEENVKGVDATHYRARVAAGEIADAAPPDAQARLRAYARLLSTSGVDEFPVDVWVDDEGVVRRVKVAYEVEANGRTVSIRFTIDLFDFGADVNVSPPPPNQVSDLQKLLKQGQGG